MKDSGRKLDVSRGKIGMRSEYNQEPIGWDKSRMRKQGVDGFAL